MNAMIATFPTASTFTGYVRGMALGKYGQTWFDHVVMLHENGSDAARARIALLTEQARADRESVRAAVNGCAIRFPQEVHEVSFVAPRIDAAIAFGEAALAA